MNILLFRLITAGKFEKCDFSYTNAPKKKKTLMKYIPHLGYDLSDTNHVQHVKKDLVLLSEATARGAAVLLWSSHII